MTLKSMSQKHQGPVKVFFNEQVDSYHTNFLNFKSGNHYRFQRRVQLANFLAKEFKNCRLLDCSCGTGEITKAIIVGNNVKYADIVDISPQMLDYAQRIISSESSAQNQINFVESDIFDFLKSPFLTSTSYDLVLCLGLIAHTGRLKELLQLIHPHLNPNGRVLLQSSLLNHWGFYLVRKFTQERYFRQKGYYITNFYLDEIIQTAEDCGFSIVGQERFGFYFPFGDNLWQWGNFYLEKSMDIFLSIMGAEVILALEPL